MNTHSGREKFSNFQILLDRDISSTIVMGKLKSKLDLKKLPQLRGKPKLVS